MGWLKSEQLEAWVWNLNPSTVPNTGIVATRAQLEDPPYFKIQESGSLQRMVLVAAMKQTCLSP